MLVLKCIWKLMRRKELNRKFVLSSKKYKGGNLCVFLLDRTNFLLSSFLHISFQSVSLKFFNVIFQVDRIKITSNGFCVIANLEQENKSYYLFFQSTLRFANLNNEIKKLLIFQQILESIWAPQYWNNKAVRPLIIVLQNKKFIKTFLKYFF